jgi:cysteine-rich repeat protein
VKKHVSLVLSLLALLAGVTVTVVVQPQWRNALRGQVGVCGNGILEGSEECDDGNNDDGDGCTSDCLPEDCGDGVVVAVEECDDGGDSADCDGDCTIVECGDYYANDAAGEECDSGGLDEEYCDADCTDAYCGDGYVNDSFEECDDGEETESCTIECLWSWCGDFYINSAAGEECDDGNAMDGDGCQSDCTIYIVGYCGDGIINYDEVNEECDDGNYDTGDGCSDECLLEYCGDHVLQEGLGEECDDGNPISNDTCTTSCIITFCGDGAIQNPSGAAIDSAMFLYYKFDEGAGQSLYDHAGESETATYQQLGPSSWTEETPDLQFANPFALQFDGVQQYASVSGYFNPSLSKATIALWVYPQSGGSTGVQPMVEKAHYSAGVSTIHYAIRRNGTTGYAELYFANTSFVTTVPIPENTWTHLAMTFDGQKLRLFKNGTESASKNVSGIITSTAPIYFWRYILEWIFGI